MLGAVVVFSVRGVADDSKDAACKTEKRTIATAIEAYRAQNTGYPSGLPALEAAGLINDANDITAASYSWDATTGKVLQGTCPAP